MEDPAKGSAYRRDWQSEFSGECLGDGISRSGPPAADPRDYESAEQTDESPQEKGVRLTVNGILVAQEVEPGLDVDHDLRERIRRHRELSWGGGLDEKAGTEVKRGCWHSASANLSGGRGFPLGRKVVVVWNRLVDAF
jgi:hypothetical protein